MTLSEKPIRIQRKRVKGWKMPPNTVYVGRPSKWGNPWTIEGTRRWLASVGVEETYSKEKRAANCVYNYKLWMTDGLPSGGHYSTGRAAIHSRLSELRGKNLACWCPLGQPCHADVLLELANQ